MTSASSPSPASGDDNPVRDRIVWGTLVCVLVGVTGAFAIQSLQGRMGDPRKAPPVISELPEFEFTERNGKAFGSRDLEGRVFVADFIFVQCAGPCPTMSARMAQLAKAFENEPDFRLVSFSVDPSRDTPAALREYAGRFQAKEGRWFFLTGDEKAIHTLARRNFRMSVERGDKEQTDPGTAILHSTYFTLVDRHGRIRGYYNSDEPEANERLLRDIRSLLGERPWLRVSDLPTLNAILNSTSAMLLVGAFIAVRRRRLVLHRNLMLSAITVSAFFLASYLTYHYLHGHQVYRGPARGIYLTILGTHTVLAIAVLPLVLVTSWLALREKSTALTGPDVKARFAKHCRIARWTFPIWLYVSVTGVIVYWMLYCR